MIEIGIFDNGAPDLPLVRTRDNIVVNDGTLREVHEAAQRSLIHQVRRGVLAERLGFDGFWLTEHHFQSEGAEMSPNPLSVQMAIAARTKRIRLGQCANIVVWWHPVRFAEQLAALDVLSGGRVECGIGRGYQPRENEVFGRVYNSTIQDQERNRKAYQEAVELIMQCWMQPSISHHGENFSVPPTYTKWNHKSTMAYYGLEKVERSVEDVLALGPPDMYAAGNPVQATTTTLKEISVFPQPLQKPHPQLWEPLTSPRSIDWAAKHGVNGVFVVEPNDRLRRNIELYYQAAAKYNWPDFRNRGPFRFGWDGEKRRGIVTTRYITVTPKGKEKEYKERTGMGMELQFDYYAPFGFGAVVGRLDEPMPDLNAKVTAEMLFEREIAICGGPQEVIDKVMKIKEACGYEDFCFLAWFEKGGFAEEETEAQMQLFAEEVMPELRRACGGGPNLPESTVELI